MQSAPVRAIEIKLSQGAKPGLGGMLPGEKVSAEIAEIRGIPEGKDCASPSRHEVFDDVDSMLDFVETVADATGLPVGIKSAVGNMTLWDQLVEAMAAGGRGVDFVNIDGGEGGTGAAPMIFADSVAYPFRIGFSEVYKRFAAAGLTDDVTFIGAGKLGIPENAVVAFALGADMVNVGREAMMAIGCIQAQKCHTDHCPVGVATQNPRYTFGLDVELKSVRAANYVRSLRRDLLKVSEAVGVVHPGLITPWDIDILDRPALDRAAPRGLRLRRRLGRDRPRPAHHDRADHDVAGRVAAAAPDDALTPAAGRGRPGAGVVRRSAPAGGPHASCRARAGRRRARRGTCRPRRRRRARRPSCAWPASGGWSPWARRGTRRAGPA